jgi:PP-loop superfamily ATP-utilizing enzyme
MKIAQGFKVKFHSLFTDELLQPEFVRNSSDREKIARIEVEPADMEKVIYYQEKIAAKLKSLGYTYIILDLEGYRPGSLNLVLN